MKYYVEWQEKATVRNRLCGWVEAESEEEAVELVKAGDVQVDDCTTWDELDSTVISIDNIYADEEMVD